MQPLFPLSRLSCVHPVCVCVHQRRMICWSLNMIYRKMKQRNLPAAVPDKGEPLTRQQPMLPAAPSTSEMKGENTCLEDKQHPKMLATPRKENLLPMNSKAGVFFPLSHHVAFRHTKCFPSQHYLCGDYSSNVNRSLTKA